MSAFDLKLLAEKFPEKDLDWRVQQAGIKDGKPWALVIPYVDARAIMDRLDGVCGPENWQVKYHQVQGGMLGEILVRVGEEWISKMDGSDETDVEAFKGSISKALVRAGVPWGIGRYLYDLKAFFADFNEVRKNTPGARMTKVKGSEEYFYWLPPKLPASALPESSKQERKADAAARGAAATDAASKVKRDLKTVQAEIGALCKRQQITPAQLNTIVASRFDVANPGNLNLEQLEDLLNFLESGK